MSVITAARAQSYLQLPYRRMIVKAKVSDIGRLSALFWEHINADSSYISHSEIQMGVAVDGGTPAPEGPQKWTQYLSAMIEGESSSVFIYEQDGQARGFVVLDVNRGLGAPWGMVCDLLVDRDLRGCGIGVQLLEYGVEWLRSKGAADIYLESGIRNHSAHEFFERKGFAPVSMMFRYR